MTTSYDRCYKLYRGVMCRVSRSFTGAYVLVGRGGVDTCKCPECSKADRDAARLAK